MQFCDWQTAKQQCLAHMSQAGAGGEAIRLLRATSAEQFLAEEIFLQMDAIKKDVPAESQQAVLASLALLSSGSVSADGSLCDLSLLDDGSELTEKVAAIQLLMRLGIEKLWFEEKRPYYNVFPVVVGLACKTRLDFQINNVVLPHKTMCFRFCASQRPDGYESAIVSSGGGSLIAVALKRLADGSRRIQLGHVSCCGESDKTIEQDIERQEETFAALPEYIRDAHPTGQFTRVGSEIAFIYRLAVIASQLADGCDLITPIVLEKDRARYEVSDECGKKWLEERASRVAGRGYDFGRTLQSLSEQSPHWRNPHLALFWTGEGRKTPRLRLRAGCVVMPKSMCDVPTGYLGEETDEEREQAESRAQFRPALPKRLRFQILRRDGYRCQLCGLTQHDGVKLEVDHKIPVARGGQTTPENLWTLCHPCNNGKSDSDLYATAKECRYESVL